MATAIDASAAAACSDASDDAAPEEMYRGFSSFMSFAFCFTAVSIVPSISLGLASTMSVGGPAEIVWSWVTGSGFCIMTALVLAEITSVYPSAGAVYNWAKELAPGDRGLVASYITGWFNLLGNVGAGTAFASAFAVSVKFAVALASPSTSFPIGVQVGISLLVLPVWAALNELRTDRQGLLNNFSIFFQLTASFFIVGMLLALTPQRASAHDVFFRVNDTTGLSSDPRQIAWETCALGFTSCLFAFAGYDAGAKMAEETVDASTAAPWGIVGTVLICSVSGFVYILGLLFATPDITIYSNPLLETYKFAAGQDWGFVLMLMLLVMYFLAGCCSLTAASRIAFAMARDGALPFSRWLKKVDARTHAPTHCVFFVMGVEAVLLLTPLVSSSALDAFLGTCTIGFQISYAVPICLRCTVARSTWQPGRWNLGRFSFPLACGAATFQILSSALFFFPTKYPVTLQNMNWTWAVVFGTLLVAAANWHCGAQRPLARAQETRELSLSWCDPDVANVGSAASARQG